MNGLRAYCTLADVKQRNDIAVTDTGDDGRILRKIRRATTMIEEATKRIFEPTQAARQFDWHSSTKLLWSGSDLLTLDEVENGDDSTVDASTIVLLGDGPYYGLQLNSGTLTYQTVPKKAITVTGVWGWHPDYANAWRGSGDTVQNNSLSDSSTTLTVTDEDAVDLWGYSPRFSPGQLIAIEQGTADEEWCYVVANLAAESMQIIRGVGGTTAVDHAQGSSIHIYTPPQDVIEECARLAALLMSADGTDFGKIQISADGTKVIPEAIKVKLPQHYRVRVR